MSLETKTILFICLPLIVAALACCRRIRKPSIDVRLNPMFHRDYK